MMEELILRVLAKAAKEELATPDLWSARRFGRSLSGRMYRIEIQTLFRGNTRDQDQIRGQLRNQNDRAATRPYSMYRD